MSYIYKITNIKNGKSYIGNTSYNIQKRWSEHCRDARKDRCIHRPLYAAMNKYGSECFRVEVIEECEKSIASDRERYWIERLGTFKNGYNATMGGDGKPYIDYELVVNLYKRVGQEKKTAEILGISPDAVNYILKEMEEIRPKEQVCLKFNTKPVLASTNGIVVKAFTSIREAAMWVKTNNGTSADESTIRKHIYVSCENKRRNAYGYKWEYAVIA